MADPIQPTTGAGAIAASALQAQQARMRVIAQNLANADSTSQTPGGTPYQRQVPVFTPTTVAGGGRGVSMSRVVNDQAPFGSAYEPGNPGANAQGYVSLPNVNPLMEALDMQEAQRAYQANLSVIETANEMDESTLSLIKK
jgi:flagellar basal-body rod protein FlgC